MARHGRHLVIKGSQGPRSVHSYSSQLVLKDERLIMAKRTEGLQRIRGRRAKVSRFPLQHKTSKKEVAIEAEPSMTFVIPQDYVRYLKWQIGQTLPLASLVLRRLFNSYMHSPMLRFAADKSTVQLSGDYKFNITSFQI